MGARIALSALWLVHWLPLSTQAAIGRVFGALLYRLAGSRRRIALRNLELCFPQMAAAERETLAREHFGWLGRSLIERGLLWWAPRERLKKLIHVEGEVTFAERSDRPVMWLVPHFLGLDVAGAAVLLFQKRRGASIYQAQTHPVIDAVMRKGRLRLGNAVIFPRSDKALPLVREIRRGAGFFNLPDMDFGGRDAEFLPFFGVSASTLVAPARMAKSLGMHVQPVVATLLPGGRGYRVRFLEPLRDWPGDDPIAATAWLNRYIEERIREEPAQYLWVHKRFKTRPPGEASLYAAD